MICGICRRERDNTSMEKIVLDDEQRAYARRNRGVDATEFWFCRPCHNLLKDPIQGAQLIKGTLQVNLTAQGHPNAEKIAQQMYEGLLKLVALKRKPPAS